MVVGRKMYFVTYQIKWFWYYYLHSVIKHMFCF